MQPVSAFVVFMIIWWLVIFCVLPVGLSSTHEVEEDEKGIRAPGAPKSVNIKKKLMMTTLISFVLWCIIFFVIEAELFDLRDFVLQGE